MEEIRALLPRDLVAAQAEMFLVSGDMNSNLYTSSRAMHSAIIGLLQVGALRKWLSRVHQVWCEVRAGHKLWRGLAAWLHACA